MPRCHTLVSLLSLYWIEMLGHPSSKAVGIIASWENWREPGLRTSNIWIHAPPTGSASTQTLIMKFSHHSEPVGPFNNARSLAHKLISPHCFLLYIPFVFPLGILSVVILKSFAWKPQAVSLLSCTPSQPGDVCVLLLLPMLFPPLLSKLPLLVKKLKLAVSNENCSQQNELSQGW